MLTLTSSSKWLDQSNQDTQEHDRQNAQLKSENDNVGPQQGFEKEENRAQYIEPPLLPSEKRKIYLGPETPALAPLTTQVSDINIMNA